MTEDEILSTITAVIGAETGSDAAVITRATTADDVPGWDSLAHIRIMLELGGRLGVAIDIERTYRAATVGDLIPIVKASPLAL